MMTMSLLFVSFIVVAQTRVLTGKVVDENASPLAGATIKVKGSTIATSSNADGDFSVEIPTDAKSLEVSFIGYLTKDVPISGNDITIALEPNADHGLDEVVVIGYGTARKKDLTGAMVTIGAKDFNKGLMTSPDQLIQGKTPGVMVINNTGQPGGSTTVRIRGNSSIRASNNPLFVLDGVPMSGNSPLPEGRGGFSSDRGNPLTYLNPGDIASMDILKDASATAIYGSRGANGVVIITTKKGKIGSPEVSVGASTGISSMREYPDVLTAARFREALNYYTPSEAANADFGAEEDAFKAITRNAVTQNYYADVSGGTEHGKYRLSGGYLNQNGIIKGSQLKKYTANFTGNFRFLESKKTGTRFLCFPYPNG
ncbi:Enterobactin outer-membrane receptor [Sphingobacterium spiritivorum]|uniref:Enterobactin outer-membrane receptor n=2 Tax=Sphingobacterium spiritivorum TaxID=258 RepID=A0A380C404_SPHSI|nr:Enterobactin outer-membrane receptor [Sphingobacterium spiritivorum]